MPGTIFDDNFTGPTCEWLADEISHYKYGCILEADQVANGLIADVKVDLAVEQSTGNRALVVLPRAKEAVTIISIFHTNQLIFNRSAHSTGQQPNKSVVLFVYKG